MINASVFEIMKTTTSFFLFFRHVPVGFVNLSDCLGGGDATPHIAPQRGNGCKSSRGRIWLQA